MFNNKLQANYSKEIKTAQQWREFIHGGRSHVARPCANNTTARLINEGKDVAIKLHDTDIITLNSDTTYTLNSGGWQSMTTKERINRYTPAGISQKAGIWYMKDGSLFYDGMLINSDGLPLKPKQSKKYEQKLKAIKADAKQYATAYVNKLKMGEIPVPSGGDCWACLMRGPKGDEAFKGSGHIRDHIDECYYVPSLLVNAGRAAGYQDHQIGLMGIGGHRLFIEPEKIIYKYVVNELKKEL